MADALQTFLSDPQNLQSLPERISRMAASDDVDAAREYVALLADFFKSHPKFAAEFPEAAATYERGLLVAKFVAFRAVPVKEAELLLARNLSVALEIPEYQLIEKVKEFLRQKDYNEREAARAALLAAVTRSAAPLSKSNLKVAGTSVPGSVENWLKDYQTAVGAETDTLQRAKYFTAGENYKKADPQEQERIKRVVELQEYLKLPSLSFEGFEEEVFLSDGSGYYRDGKLVEIDDATRAAVQSALKKTTSVTDEELKRIYLGSPEERAAVAAAIKDLAARGDTAALVKKLSELAVPRTPTAPKSDAIQLVALLRLLNESGALENALRKNSWFQNLVISHYTSKNRLDDVSSFKLQPDLPQHLETFLRALLEERGGFSASESARIGAQLGNALKKKGRPGILERVFFDVKTKSFQWVNK